MSDDKTIPCKACGKEISNSVSNCPHCGQRLGTGGWGAGLLSKLAMGLIGLIFVKMLMPETKNETDKFANLAQNKTNEISQLPRYSPPKFERVIVTDSPRPFSAVAPAGWSRQPPGTANSRLSFLSPNGDANCAVIVKTIPGLRGHSQSEMSSAMTVLPDKNDVTRLLVGYSNVRVLSIGKTMLSGVPAQTYEAQMSVGTPDGKLWSRGVFTTTLTTPDLSWTVGCTSQGSTLEEASKAFDHWQIELVKFPTSIKFLADDIKNDKP